MNEPVYVPDDDEAEGDVRDYVSRLWAEDWDNEDDEFETDEATFDAMMAEGEPVVLVDVPETAPDRWRKLRGQYPPQELDPEAADDLLNEVREFSELRRRATTRILGGI